jgi:phosphohistidine phosphatase SixA
MWRRHLCLFISMLGVISVQAWCASFPITVFVVRHAEKADLPTGDPVLSEAGKLRAKSLSAVLADAGISAIYTSQATRARLTALPLANRLHLEANREFADQQALAQAILQRPGRSVLVVGHSNTVPQLIQALGGGLIPDIQEAWEFDNLYVVTIFGPGQVAVSRLHYGKPSMQGPVTLEKGGAGTMRITIATSGGIAAMPGLAMKAELDLSGKSARVTQVDGSYARDLSAQEAEAVRGMVDPARLAQLPREMRPLSSSSADQRQYDITIRSDDGSEHTVTVSEMMAGDLERQSPGMGKFLEWTKQEFRKIKDYNVQQRDKNAKQ